VCAGTLSFVLLLLYVFQLLDRSEASLGRTLFNFKGRTGRRTFWVMLIAAVALSIPGYVHQWLAQSGQAKILVPDILAYVLFSPPALIVSLAAQVKRWHDRDKSGWLVLVNFIPIAGAIWTIVELGFLRGTNGANKFGPQPEPAPEVPQGDPA